MPPKKEGTSAYVLVDMNWTLGLDGFGNYGPGTNIVVPRTFAERTGLTIKGEADDPEGFGTAGTDQENTSPRARKNAKEKGQGEGADFDPATAPKEFPTDEEGLAKYNVAVLEAEYARRVDAGELQAVEQGSGAGGALIKDDYVRALGPNATK